MHCLILGKLWPEPESTAAGRRTCDVIEALQFAGWQVSLASAAHVTPLSEQLSERGVDCHAIQVNDSAFDTWIRDLAPDVVIFDRFMTEEQFGWRVESSCPTALRVLDTSDLHSLREARLLQLKSGDPLNLKNESALREIAAIYRCDCTIMISEYEISLLDSEFFIPDPQLLYWPFHLEAPELSQLPDYDSRSDFILIGSFLHKPNLDAVRWCRESVWPLIRSELPEAELHCFGSYGDAYAGELKGTKDGFYFKGRAMDALAEMSTHRINLAPLRFGAGLKGKIFDGFATGTPAVSTPIGLEGIVSDMEWGCVVAEDAASFAKAAVELYRDAERWKSAQVLQSEVAKQRFSSKYWRPILARKLEQMCSNLESVRTENFIGCMLRHHHHRSTEYMSRWIETKNRLSELKSFGDEGS